MTGAQSRTHRQSTAGCRPLPMDDLKAAAQRIYTAVRAHGHRDNAIVVLLHEGKLIATRNDGAFGAYALANGLPLIGYYQREAVIGDTRVPLKQADILDDLREALA